MREQQFLLAGIVFICLTSHLLPTTNAANILGLFTSPSVSHLVVHIEMAKLLAERGHNVTIVVPFEPKVNYQGINVILIPPTEQQERTLQQDMTNMSQQKKGLLSMIKLFLGTFMNFVNMQADVLRDPRFTVLYDNPDTKFDLVILGFFMNNYQLGVAAKFKTPVIVNWPSVITPMTNRFIGNPAEISYVPGMSDVLLRPGEKFNFLQRLQNLVMNLIFDAIMGIMDIRMKQHYRDIFPIDGSFPTLDEMQRNVSLVFCNSHFSDIAVRPNVPALVEIGAIQIKGKPDALPNDLAKLLTAANDTGAILFSLGSNFKGSNLKPAALTAIFNGLSKLKQKVIWKWDDLDKTPGNSPNILYKKWLPQGDLLAHPNLKLFITHAGRGGITEAKYHGVPMLAIPLFGDQNDNANKMVKSGYGLQVDILTLTEDNFRQALSDVLNNPQYRENVQSFSRLYRDRPLSARQSFIYWTEYVLRHHGAAHMQSPLVHMNFIEANNLDVFAFLILVIYVGWNFVKIGYKTVRKTTNSKEKYNGGVEKVKKQ